MFETVTLTIADIDKIVDALAYYRKVRLVTNINTLSSLIGKIGFDNFRRCIQLGGLNVLLETHSYGILTENTGLPVHKPITFKFETESDGTKIRSAAHYVELTLHRDFKRHPDVKQIIKFVLDNVIFRPEMSTAAIGAEKLFEDTEYVRAATAAMLKELVPHYSISGPLDVSITAVTGGYFAFFDLDFEQLNKLYHEKVPETHSSLSPAFLLAHFLTAQRDILCATEGDTDFWGGSAECACIQARVEKALAVRRPAGGPIRSFHENILKRPSFGSLIESGDVTFDRFLDLLEAADTERFKLWLSKQSPTSDIVQEYYRSVFSNAPPAPLRLFKVAIFSGLGAIVDVGIGTLPIGSIAGAAAGALIDAGVGVGDEFVLSKLARGWRPDQWIEGPVKDFYGER